MASAALRHVQDGLSVLRDLFGWRLLLTIVSSHHLLKGFVGGGCFTGLLGTAMEFTYRAYGVAGPDLQVSMTVAFLPFSVKAAMGVISDSFPLLGYRKSSYLLLCAVLGAPAYLLLGFRGRSPASSIADAAGAPLPLPLLTLLFFVAYFQMVMSDLLVEARYSERMKSEPEGGPLLVTFVMGGVQVFSLAANFASGWLVQSVGPWSCFLVAAPFAALIGVPAACNYLEEKRLAVDGCFIKADASKWSGAGRVPFLIASAVGTSAVGLAFVSVLARSLRVKFAVACAVGLLDLALFSIFLRPSIARVNAFFFLQNAFHIGTHGASFYFFTDNARQYPEGPHFSPRFFVTTIGMVASAFALLGMVFYNRCAKNWKYRSSLVAASLAYAAVNAVSVLVYTRLNLWLNIPDWVFMLASSAMQSAISQLTWMPLAVMLSQLCPEGLESTMYALMGGSLNLGLAVSNYAGAFALHELGVRPNGSVGEGAQFDNLWKAALISAVGPCVPLLLVRVLIPDAHQTDRLLEGGDTSSATAGSSYERWCAGDVRSFYDAVPGTDAPSRSRSDLELPMSDAAVQKSRTRS